MGRHDAPGWRETVTLALLTRVGSNTGDRILTIYKANTEDEVAASTWYAMLDRMVRRGWLTAEKVGRERHFAVAPAGVEELNQIKGMAQFVLDLVQKPFDVIADAELEANYRRLRRFFLGDVEETQHFMRTFAGRTIKFPPRSAIEVAIQGWERSAR
jgi:DNA-binding PadR family transcriptional regulator